MQNGTAATTKDRKNERGAALVMALLMSFLLLVGVAGVLLEASMNSANVTDANAEQQAYNAAESGIQAAVNVLRGNVIVSDPNRIDLTKPATDKANKADFVKAIVPQFSNLTTSGFDTTPRLSRWLNYESATYADRVKLGAPATAYATREGSAFSLSISDPDNTGSSVTYWTKGILNNCDHQLDGTGQEDPNLPCQDSPTYPHKTYYENSDRNSPNFTRITYIPAIISNQDLSPSGNPNVNFGSFKVEVSGNGGQIQGFNRFEIVVNMTVPYRSQRSLRGWIETNANPFTNPPKIIFDSQTYTLQGSLITLGFNTWTGQPSGVTCASGGGPWTLPALVNCPNNIPQRVGYEAKLNLGDNIVTGTMSEPEPTRLVIQSTGYGPRGSVKKLEAIIQKNFFNGLSAPATLTLVGAACPSGQSCFNPGSSSVTVYSGDDSVSTDNIPPIGTTNSENLDMVQGSVDGQPPHPFNGTVVGVPSNVSNEIPDWLSSPSQMDLAIHSLADTAEGSPDPVNPTGRFFPSGTNPTTFGDNASGTGITFCDGNCTFTGDGGGMLIVTGQLTLHGNFNFRGLIIVTGSGGVSRTGGGDGFLDGNIVIAPYANGSIEDDLDPDPTAQFLPPRYDLSGGGTSTVQYNSSSIANGLTAVSNFVLGVAEK